VIDKRSGPLLRICDDRFIPGLAELVKEVHEETDSKIGLQIVHFLKLARTGYRQKVEDLSSEEIQEIIEATVRAAVRVRRAGFDAVEWDAESGMTLSSFLSRLNKRRDGYGGNLENRLRILLEILKQTRREVGDDFVIGARINGDDFVLGGTTLKQSTVIASRLAEEGVDYISVSCGGKFEDATPQPGKPLDCYSGYSGKRAGPVGICLMRRTSTLRRRSRKRLIVWVSRLQSLHREDSVSCPSGRNPSGRQGRSDRASQSPSL